MTHDAFTRQLSMCAAILGPTEEYPVYHTQDGRRIVGERPTWDDYAQAIETAGKDRLRRTPILQIPRRTEMSEVFPRRACVGDRERCCGRRPLPYKEDGHWFCTRCDAAYRMPDGAQIPNWAWQRCGDGFLPTYPQSEGAAFARASLSRNQEQGK